MSDSAKRSIAAGLRWTSLRLRLVVVFALVGVHPFTAKLFRILKLEVPLCRSTEEALWCLLPPTDEEIRDWLS